MPKNSKRVEPFNTMKLNNVFALDMFFIFFGSIMAWFFVMANNIPMLVFPTILIIMGVGNLVFTSEWKGLYNDLP